ncbi:uncharacterized protein LOC120397968 [Mauremys reevesii]|uniref:uncharacterized protein LOC120397968 n=1 Tax=Mauremys reevesii TaxID=260615 RepID=UPI00193FA213|nr:uncharacterized protein LOC120397968 [Mauremys reevesii]
MEKVNDNKSIHPIYSRISNVTVFGHHSFFLAPLGQGRSNRLQLAKEKLKCLGGGDTLNEAVCLASGDSSLSPLEFLQINMSVKGESDPWKIKRYRRLQKRIHKRRSQLETSGEQNTTTGALKETAELESRHKYRIQEIRIAPKKDPALLEPNETMASANNYQMAEDERGSKKDPKESTDGNIWIAGAHQQGLQAVLFATLSVY